VLELVTEGLHNAEIAERLVISERTVKSHTNNIFAKLHVADRCSGYQRHPRSCSPTIIVM